MTEAAQRNGTVLRDDPADRQAGSGAGAPASPVGGRLHWIDWLRLIAIVGVVLFHTLRPFNTSDWHVKNAEQSALIDGLIIFLESFGLAVVFLLAGVGARFALRRRSWAVFVRERTSRLLLPFIAGTVLLGPIQGYLEVIQKEGYAGSYLDYLARWASQLPGVLDNLDPTIFGVGYHLWFLGFLFAISIVALPLCRWLLGERGGRVIGAFARWLTVPGSMLLVAVPIFVLMGLGGALGTDEHDWFEFAWYTGYFLVGFVLVSDDRFMAAVRRDLWAAVVVAVVATMLIYAGIPAPLDTIMEQDPLTFLTMGLLFAAQGWGWTLVVLNLGMRIRSLQRPVSEHLGDAVLPLYVLHQPVILAVAFFVVQWPLGILPKWTAILFIAGPITLLLVELALRTPITRILIGARVRAGGPSVPPAPRRALPPEPAGPREAARHARPG